ncbi:MAG: hypothetical protein VB050_17015 [Geobacteraceae bacterium]|nr:hypothetical protein [Geobacteraceae bacterium]
MKTNKLMLLSLIFVPILLTSVFSSFAIGESYTYEYRGPSYYWDNSTMQYDHLEMSFTLSSLLPASSSQTIDLLTDPSFSLNMTVGPVSMNTTQSVIASLSAFVHSTDSSGTPTSWTIYLNGEDYLINSQYTYDPMVVTPYTEPGACYGVDKLVTTPDDVLLWDSGLQGMEIPPSYLWKSNLNPTLPVPEPTIMVLLGSVFSLVGLKRIISKKSGSLPN